MPARRRRRPARLLPHGLTSRLDRAIRWRVDEAVAPLQERTAQQAERILQLEVRLNERLPEAVQKANRAFTEVERMQPQTASMEQRIEELRQRLDQRLAPATPEERAEAQSLLDAVRREHEQIRARTTAIAWYEDRLRKLEEAAQAERGT